MPTLREIKLHPEDYPTWQICPKCRGGRGAIEFGLDENGTPTFTTVPCTLCLGVKIVAK